MHATTHPRPVDDPIDATASVVAPSPAVRGDDEGGGVGPPPGRPAPAAGGCGLAFTEPGGPLVAVCGLHGGAGTSTLAYALAATAARESSAPVLLCESDSATGDIAGLTGIRSPRTLTELASDYATGVIPVGGTLARAGDLRVIAGAPTVTPSAPDGALSSFLTAAQARHGLTVVDAATIRSHGTREILATATHIIWVTIARAGSPEAARQLLASDLVPTITGTQLLAVRGAQRGRLPAARRAARELRQLAEHQCDRLVYIADQPGDPSDLTGRRIRGALTALASPIAQKG